MWICLSDSFISIVRKNQRDKFLTVRARVAGDIERIWPLAEVQKGGGTDYLYRARIYDKDVAEAITNEILGIGYSNFKDSVTENARHDAYFNIWRAMMAMREPRQDFRQPGFFDSKEEDE